MISVLDIGNTHARIRTGDAPIRYVSTKSFSAEDLPEGPCAAACVVPGLLPMLREHGVFLVSQETACGIDFSQMDASTLGADRIANAAALIETGTLPALSIDCGTAVTFELIAPGKIFLGGAILPGRAMLRRSLHSNTGQLPEIPLCSKLPDFPGRNTAEAILLGTDGIILSGVRDLIEKAEKHFPGQTLRVVVCGGDAPFFHKHIPRLELAEDTFTLDGILAIYRKAHSCV